MPRWVIVLIVAPLALCVTCVSAGYFVIWPRIDSALSEGQQNVSNALADAVAASVSSSIDASDLAAGELVIAAADLNANNTYSPGEAGIQTGTDGTWIYGLVTRISPAGLALALPPDDVIASAVPRIEGGRVEFTQVEIPNDVMRLVLSSKGFENGMEEGINRALAANGLTPTAITLRDGSMTIQVDRDSRSSVVHSQTSQGAGLLE